MTDSVFMRFAWQQRRILLFCALVFSSTSARTDDLVEHLKNQYSNKLVLLRNFYPGSKLTYDSGGQLIGVARPGEWTVDGVIELHGVRTSDRRLELKGKRIFVFSPSQSGLSLVRSQQEVRIQVELDSQPITVSRIDSVLSKIFLNGQDRFSDVVPQHWKPCVTLALSDVTDETYLGCHFLGDLAALVKAGSVAKDDPGVLAARHISVISLVHSDFDHKVNLNVRAGVTPPQPIVHGDPEFSDAARKVRAQGTLTLMLIVDQSGFPQDIRVARPLGCGLDEQAVHAVEGWKFKPAEKDGQPVAVEIAVEVDFRLR
jgi:TonB family protein